MKKTILLLAVFGFIIITGACQKGEEATISKYFEAMKVNDTETMSSMASEPKKIEFKSFKIVSIAEPTVGPLEVFGLEKKLADLTEAKKKEIDVHVDKKFALDDLTAQMEETSRRDQKVLLQKQIDEATADLDARKATIKGIQKQMDEVKKMIGIEKSLIKASTGIEKNYELYTGETHIIKANVQITIPDGSTQDYIFLMRKNILTLDNKPIKGRLVITKIATVQEFEKAAQQKTDEAKVETQQVSEEKTATDAAGTEQ